MKVVYYFYSAFSGTMLGILLDEARKMSVENGDDVYFVMCDGFLDLCLSNPTGNKGVCSVCKLLSLSTIKKQLGDKVKILYLKNFLIDNTMKVALNYINASELIAIEYKNVKVGYASLSTYVHLTRNQQPKIDASSKKFFDALLNQSARLTDSFSNLLLQIKPDKVCTYNGRFNEVRPVYEVAKTMNIPVSLYEVVPIDDTYYKIVFDNILPHSVKGNLWQIEKCWNNTNLSEGENISIGKSFFEKRRKGIIAGDKVYTGKQTKGLLPRDWDNRKINIVIFNSSEDEFVAIGDEYDSLSLFPSQIIGLKAIFEEFKDQRDIHFYLRIHPNLKNVKYKYHSDLYKMGDIYDNVTIISPSDSISTYDLMDAAEKVIVFGSTMGLESVYWGKPVILLSCAIYYYSDICCIPNSPKELFSLISHKLAPKYNDDVLKFGVFFLNNDPLIIDREQQFKYIDYNSFKKNMLGKTYHGFNYQKMLGSKGLFAFFLASIRYGAQLLCKNRFVIPLEDE